MKGRVKVSDLGSHVCLHHLAKWMSLLIWRGFSVTSINYCDMLRNNVRPATRTNHRGRMWLGVVLLHYNARPHKAQLPSAPFGNWTAKFWSTCLQSRPGLFRFPSVWTHHRRALNCRKFADDDEVKEAVDDWLRNKKNIFNGIKNLEVRWAKLIF